MPTYQYRCKDCANELEVVQKFTDDPLTDCPVCDKGELRKVFNAVGVVFKGSGFYRTDSRASSGKSEPTPASTESGSKPAPDSTPAKTPSESGASKAAPASVGSAG